MRTSLYLFSFFLFFITGCSNEPDIEQEEPENNGLIEDSVNQELLNEVYFTFNIDNKNLDSENWIILYDETGNLLDYKSYNAKDFLEFKKRSDSIPKSITVTLFSTTQSSPSQYAFSSISQVEIGTKWNIIVPEVNTEITDSEISPVIGEFELEVSEAKGPDYYKQNLLTNIKGYGAHITGYTIFHDENGLSTYKYNPISIKENENNYLYSKLDYDLNLKYYWFENIQPNDKFNVKYSDFSDYDSYLDLPFVENQYFSLNILAFENDNVLKQKYPNYTGYILLDIDSNTYSQSGPVNPGYLDRFNWYRTEIHMYRGIDKPSFHYLNYSDKPEISIPESDFNITNKSLSNLTFSTNISYVRKESLFTTNFNGVDPITYWRVYSGEDQYPKIGIVPQELLNLYPEIDLDNLEYSYTNLYLDFSYSHEDYLNYYKNTLYSELSIPEVYLSFFDE